jgi:hypothetical protein
VAQLRLYSRGVEHRITGLHQDVEKDRPMVCDCVGWPNCLCRRYTEKVKLVKLMKLMKVVKVDPGQARSSREMMEEAEGRWIEGRTTT